MLRTGADRTIERKLLQSWHLLIREREAVKWQHAIAQLLKAAELGGGWPFFARVPSHGRCTASQTLNLFQHFQTKSRVEGETGCEEAEMITVWIYTDTSKQVGDPDQLKVFAGRDDADKWFKQHVPEGVAFEYPVIGELYERMIRRPIP